MDAFKTAFEKLKELKGSIDSSAAKGRKDLIDMNAKIFERSGMTPEEAQKQASTITGLAEGAGSMAGSIGDVAGKAAKGIGSGVAKIFRDPDALVPTANRAAKALDLQNTMGMGKFLGKTGQGLPGATSQSRLDNLPSYAKEAVLKLMREKGIDPSTFKKAVK
jgi:hypothetical protein